MAPAPSEASILAAYGISRTQSRQARKTVENEGPSVFKLSKARQDADIGYDDPSRRRPCSAPAGAMSADEIRSLIGTYRPRTTEYSMGQSDLSPLLEVPDTQVQEKKRLEAQMRTIYPRERSRSPIVSDIQTSTLKGTSVSGYFRPQTAPECPPRIRHAASLSKIITQKGLQEKAQTLRRVESWTTVPRSKSRYRSGFSRPQSRAASSPRFPRRPPAFSGVSSIKNATDAMSLSPSETLALLKRRRIRDKEVFQSRTDTDLHDDQVYFTDYAMRVRARKMWHRELKAAKEAASDQMVTKEATTPLSNSTEDFSYSKDQRIILLEGAEKNEVEDAVERLLGRMRGLGEASECVKGLAVTAGLVPKAKKLPRLSGKGNQNSEVEKDLFTLQVRELKGQLKDSLFDVIREQEVQADVAKTMADAFKHVHGRGESPQVHRLDTLVD